MNTVTPTALFARRFLADYARNPVNLLFIVLVPVVFVVVAAGSLAETAKVLGGAAASGAVQTATAGWAAGLLSVIAMSFQHAVAARGRPRHRAARPWGSPRPYSASTTRPYLR